MRSGAPANHRRASVSEVFELALDAADMRRTVRRRSRAPTLTVIDYSRPSTEKRLWVFDLRARAALRELVAHGQGSGDNLATRFSNEPDTHQTSLGLFVTGDTYVGRNGYSLRLDGLDQGFNDRALRAGDRHARRAVRERGVRQARTAGSAAAGDARRCATRRAQGDRPRQGRRAGVRVLPGSRLARLVEVSGRVRGGLGVIFRP